MKRSRRRRQEGGYALLLVFLMAAVIAISLYQEIPRVAFESQRQKELLLVDRGEQYKRAIQVFMKANNRYPGKIEDLENTNNRRFLRKRFIDPMTGEEEWRLIHINNGILTDSLVQKGKQGQQQGAVSSLVGEIAVSTADASMNGGQAGVNPGLRRRASDGMAPGVGFGTPNGQPPADPNNPNPQNDPNNPQGQQNPQNPGYPNANGQAYPGMPLQPGQTPQPGQYPGTAGLQPGQYPGAAGLQPGQYPGNAGLQPSQYPGQYPGAPGLQPGQYPGAPGTYPQYPGQPINSQQGGVSASPYPYNQPGVNGQSPLNPTQGSNQAAQMIQQILTSPRQGGMPGGAYTGTPGAFGAQIDGNAQNPYSTTPGANGASPGATQPGMSPMGTPIQGTTGQTIGGGIVGVASKMDSEGILIYGDKTNYKEWEFIFDPSKIKPLPNPVTNAVPTQPTNVNNQNPGMTNSPGQANTMTGATPTATPHQ